MCGIVGYIGNDQAVPVLLQGLEKLEYRGYDSAGVAVFSEDGLKVVKSKGRLRVLSDLLDGGKALTGTLGIGHTRWATHGAPSDVNSHPQVSEGGRFAVVHNGIIENYLYLKQHLMRRGIQFVSETDTEVVAQMLEYYDKGDILETIEKVISKVEGSYALGIISADHPDCIYAVRKDSPLIVGVGDGENYIASDIPAFLPYTRDVVFLEDGEIVRITDATWQVLSLDTLEPVHKEVQTVQWDMQAARKGGFKHFMLKEIHEQPKAVRDTISPRIHENEIDLGEIGMTDEEIKNLRKISIVACGSAYHTGAAGKYVIEELARIPVETDLASEFRYRNPIYQENSLVIIVSQSGETADSLAALRDAKAHGCKVLSIVNVVGSSIARESDAVLYTWAGPEISVATTKAYSCQLAVFYLLALKFAQIRSAITPDTFQTLLTALKQLPDQIEGLLSQKEKIQFFANHYLATEHIFFMGRGIDYAISMEGSLKLKEISYIHSEAYAAGELKHGTISLMEEGTLVVALATQDALYPKTVSNMIEVKTRGAFVMALSTKKHPDIEKYADYVLYIPETQNLFAGSLAIIPLQLFAYYVSLGRGLDVDKPRNLAKSVTVE